MSTGSAQPPPSLPNHLDATDFAPSPRRHSLYSFDSDFDSGDDYSQLVSDYGAPIDFMEEGSRGNPPPSNMTNTSLDGASHTQDNTTIDTRQEDYHSTFEPGNTDYDDSTASLTLPPLPDNDDSSLYLLSSEDGDRERMDNQTFMEEKEMRRKLMDMESSFLPEPSTVDVATTNRAPGVDDTYLVGVSAANQAGSAPQLEFTQPSIGGPDESSHDIGSSHDGVPIPQTPSLGAQEDTKVDQDMTPSANSEQYEDNTTMLEAAQSSPTEDAKARSVIRNPLTTSQDAVDASQSFEDTPNDTSLSEENPDLSQESLQAVPRNLSSGQYQASHDTSTADIEGISRTSSRRSLRPKYLTSRQSAHRLSYSSVTTSNTEVTSSDATLGADYALQSGGAAPGSSGPQPGRRDPMARSVSLGSMASGVSGYSDENFADKKNRSHSATERGLQTLNEEEGTSPSRPESPQQQQLQQQGVPEEPPGPMTPKAKAHDNFFPSDTVIAERVKDVQVPSTFVKQFREDFGARGGSPDKRAGATPAFSRSGRTMTLKEQSSTIDRLSKENFDLKMRIHFLNEALNRRSEEGVKEMISENVELKSDKLKLQKDNQTLKRKIRDLEKQMKDQQSDKDSMVNHDPEGSDGSDRDPAQDEEIIFLRERVETYELEIERMRSESIARESEKRRLAEVVKSLSDGRPMGSDVGAREERDMWKDMLEAETAAREQAEEENKGLRDETLRLRAEMSMAVVPARSGPRDRMGSMASYSGASERELIRHTTAGSSSSSTLVMELELLKQENAELRKEVSAQTSMLTSRNREKERLYQEIEELKLGQRREGVRSITGDSIFDRSASRAQGRSSSRASDGTGRSPIEDAEREDLELRNGQMRDQISALKLENQDIRAQLDEYVQELEAFDKAYQADFDQADADIRNLQQERDQAVHMANERDAAFQDLRAEAQEELDVLGEEFDQKVHECQRLGEELRSQDENFRALQAEMRSASEGIIRLEEDAQNNLHRYQAVQREMEDCNREMESLEKNLYEANTKVQRLTVQIESSQNEIAFLREEQDGDKIKIGNLELELKTYRMDLQSEKEKARGLEDRLAEERHQREVVGSKEKQEVQRIINELNREATAAKEEARKLKKSLSAQEMEANTWRERLMELENNLRETLGDLTGSRSSLISNIMKLQKSFEATALELESVRSKLEEKESLLRNRDALLESHGLESRKLAELLERERHARRADKQSFEKALKSHHQASRTITQNNSKISDLEMARSQDRKRFNGVEQQFKDQLAERNAMLLAMWKRLSTMCGPDWAHSNSLINGNLPSQEVIGNILFWPGFSRNLLLAMKTVEHVFSGFKSRIKDVERDLTKQYQTLEHHFNQRSKKLDSLIESMVNVRAQQYTRSQSGLSPEMAKLRGENRLLKAELNLVQSHSRSRGSAVMGSGSPRSARRNPHAETRVDADPSSLVRHNSVVERSAQPSTPRGLARSSTSGIPQPSHVSSTTTLADGAGAMVHGSRSRPGGDSTNEMWIQRLRELEKKLKAEREGRLLDRSGARKRLEERDAENVRLRALIERQRVRKGISTETSTDDDGGHSRAQQPGRIEGPLHSREEEPSSSEGEGIYVDIEV